MKFDIYNFKEMFHSVCSFVMFHLSREAPTLTVKDIQFCLIRSTPLTLSAQLHTKMDFQNAPFKKKIGLGSSKLERAHLGPGRK